MISKKRPRTWRRKSGELTEGINVIRFFYCNLYRKWLESTWVSTFFSGYNITFHHFQFDFFTLHKILCLLLFLCFASLVSHSLLYPDLSSLSTERNCLEMRVFFWFEPLNLYLYPNLYFVEEMLNSEILKLYFYHKNFQSVHFIFNNILHSTVMLV